jgi:hypothetical protein
MGEIEKFYNIRHISPNIEQTCNIHQDHLERLLNQID